MTQFRLVLGFAAVLAFVLTGVLHAASVISPQAHLVTAMASLVLFALVLVGPIPDEMDGSGGCGDIDPRATPKTRCSSDASCPARLASPSYTLERRPWRS